MKRLILVALLVTFQLLLRHQPANAQVQATVNPTGKVVMVYLYALNNGYNASFDTGGQTIGGLSSADLSKKFFRASAATILNFVIENGYRVIGFSATEAKTFDGTGNGLEGYAVLLEQIK